jgi:hypothetical protein
LTASPRLRKAIVTAHVVSSVGWMGAVSAYVSLDVAAVTSPDVHLVRGAYVAMELVAYAAIVPLALATVVVGLVAACSTPWGVVRHYWVLVKLLLTLVATAVLLVETQTISALADAAMSDSDPRELPGTLPHSIGGVVVLLIATALSIFKPKGMTRYGWRKQQEQRRGQARPLSPMTP